MGHVFNEQENENAKLKAQYESAQATVKARELELISVPDLEALVKAASGVDLKGFRGMDALVLLAANLLGKRE